MVSSKLVTCLMLRKLTAWEYCPNKVHKEIVDPKVQKLWPAVCDAFIIVVEHAGCIVENETINLTSGHDDLQRVA